MKATAAIVAPEVSEAEIIHRWDLATGREERAEKTLAETRLEKGRILVEARAQYPATGRSAGGWGRLLERLRIDGETARRYMLLAGYVEKAPHSEEVPTYAEAGITKQRPIIEHEELQEQDDDSEPDIEDEITPKHRYSAFLLRADQAAKFASYSGPVRKDVVDWAYRVADAWTELAHKLETKL